MICEIIQMLKQDLHYIWNCANQVAYNILDITESVNWSNKWNLFGT